MYGVSSCSAAALAAAPSTKPGLSVVDVDVAGPVVARSPGSVVATGDTAVDAGPSLVGEAPDIVEDDRIDPNSPPASRHNDTAVVAVTPRDTRLIMRTVPLLVSFRR